MPPPPPLLLLLLLAAATGRVVGPLALPLKVNEVAGTAVAEAGLTARVSEPLLPLAMCDPVRFASASAMILHA